MKSTLVRMALCLVLLACGQAHRAAAASDPYVGEVDTFAFGFCPDGWMPLNGQVLPISQNEVLFRLLGTTFGGNGRTSFALPTAKPVFSADGTTTMIQCIATLSLPSPANPQGPATADAGTGQAAGTASQTAARAAKGSVLAARMGAAAPRPAPNDASSTYSGTLQAPAGSASAPSVAVGNSQSGLFSPFAGALGFAGQISSQGTTGSDLNWIAGVGAGTSLKRDSTDTGNTFVGGDAGQNKVIGGTDTFVGFNSGQYEQCTAPACANTFLGAYAGQGVGANPLTGDVNTAVGEAACMVIQGSAGANTCIGYNALFALTTGSGNVALGVNAGRAVTTASNNVAMGEYALSGSNGSSTLTAGSNIAVGYRALYTLHGASSANTVVGYEAAFQLSSANYVTAIGSNALRSANGGANTALGALAGQSITSGVDNLILGYSVASTTLRTGSNNILLGTGSNCDTATSAANNEFRVCAQSGTTPLLDGVLTASALSLTVNGSVKLTGPLSTGSSVMLGGIATTPGGNQPLCIDSAGNVFRGNAGTC